MIQDLTLAHRVNSLDDYYYRLCIAHAWAHGPDYLAVHDEIRHRLAECESYTECGVNQGATLAAALLKQPPRVRGYDLSLAPYKPAHGLFRECASKCGIDYLVKEADSLRVQIDPVDLLYLDTLHTPKHLAAELAMHSGNVRKYIICHDTHSAPGLRDVVQKFARSSKWTIAADCRLNTGYMTLAR